MSNPSRARTEIIALLHGQRLAQAPCFSGLIHVTAAGLAQHGLHLSAVHQHPQQLAQAALSTHALCGWPSAVAPLDLCVEAEALGARVDFRDDLDAPMFPLITEPLAATIAGLPMETGPRLLTRGRLPIVLEAIQLIKKEAGDEVVVGACVPGPFTLAMQLLMMNQLLEDVMLKPQAVAHALLALTQALHHVVVAYAHAGADFITVHEMGGSPGVVGPRVFEHLILPALQPLVSAIQHEAGVPCVLSVCGRTHTALPLLAAARANALSVDQQTDLAHARAVLGREVLLFGNLDPVAVLANGTLAEVHHAAAQARAAGADALWPGCDLWPETPVENLQGMMESEPG